MVDEVRNLSLSHLEEPFPWNQLPRELQVKILQTLRRCDIENCLLVDREMFNLICSNESRMRRRVIDELLIKSSDFVEDYELFPFTTNVTSFLLETLRNCDVAHLRILMVPLTDDLLSSILSGLLDTGCRVRELSMEHLSMAAVTSTTLLRFLCEVAPAEIEFDLTACHRNLFSREILEFIVTRQYFSIGVWNHYRLPVNDDILAHLTAPEFVICAPNMITIGGLKLFMKVRLTMWYGEESYNLFNYIPGSNQWAKKGDRWDNLYHFST
ncbi:hypothetical protein GCK32_019079 [Trichostrongylus colubriformis]|uniref:F-box domain-containing protein n=1 Tax=Trichostrongylus colubriformis TaxID=6319 RepID=A0AAN8II28_TRICO